MDKEQRLDTASFERIRGLVHQHFGIHLGDQKRGLVIGRLQRVLRERQFADFPSYVEALERDQSGSLLAELADRISTNHTHFWREPAHFTAFRQEVIPWVQSLGKRDLRLWCAAAATGEEPWTLAMILRAALGKDYASWRAGLIATDISEPALRTAQAGIYDDQRVQPLPKELRDIGFQPYPDQRWRIRDELRRDTFFRRFNLMNSQLPFRQGFHCIFIRNVMIYFDQETRRQLLSRLLAQLEPGGWLFIGHSESIPRDDSSVEYVRPALYRRPLR